MADTKEKSQLIGEAVKDAAALRDAALAAAKKQLVESMTPSLRALVNREIRAGLGEDTDRLRRGIEDNWPGESHTKFEEGTGDPTMDMHDEKLESLFPGLTEMDDQEPKEESALPELAAEPVATEAKDKDEMDESVEISEEALKEFFEQAKLAEVKVKGGFGDMVGGGELEDAAKETGILDTKKGEHEWDKEEPPASQKWIPEGKDIKALIKRGIEENKALRAECADLRKRLGEASKALREQNLFAVKALHASRFLMSHGAGLSRDQKRVALESLDRAKTVDEVRNIYEVLDSTLRSASRLTEQNARKPRANAQRVRTSGGATPRVISESADQKPTSNSRWLELAGLLK